MTASQKPNIPYPETRRWYFVRAYIARENTFPCASDSLLGAGDALFSFARLSPPFLHDIPKCFFPLDSRDARPSPISALPQIYVYI